MEYITSTHNNRSSVASLFWILTSIMFFQFFLDEKYIALKIFLASGAALSLMWGVYLIKYGFDFRYNSMVVALVGFSLSNVIPSFYIALYFQDIPLLDQQNLIHLFPLLSVITSISCVIFIWGYEFSVNSELFKGISLPKLSNAINEQFIFYVMACIYLTAWIFKIVTLWQGTYYHIHVNTEFMFSNWYSVVTRISNLHLLVLLYLWIAFLRKKMRLTLPLSVTLVELAWALPSGSRSKVFFILIIMVVSFWYQRNKMPYKLVGIFLMIIALLSPIFTVYRNTIIGNVSVSEISREGTQDAFVRAVEINKKYQEEEQIGYVGSLLNRFYDGRWLAYLLAEYRGKYDWELGRTYLVTLPNIFIPSFLIDTPHITQLPLNDYFIIGSETSSCPTTYLGEAYINFGFFGFLIMPFFLGITCALFDGIFIKYHENSLFECIYLYTTYSILFLVTQSWAVWLAVLRNYIIYLYLAYLVWIVLGKPLRLAVSDENIP